MIVTQLSMGKDIITMVGRKKAGFTMNIGNLIVYTFWTLLLIGKGLGMSSVDYEMRILAWCAIPILALKLFVSKYKKKELFACFAFIFWGFIVYFFSKDTVVLLTALCISSFQGIDLKPLLKYSFWVRGILFVIITTLSIGGVLDSQTLYRMDSGSIHTMRYALGYGQPNATHYTLFVVIALYLLSYRKLKWLNYLFLEAYNIFIFTYTDSRSGFVVCTLLILLAYAGNNKYILTAFWKAKVLDYVYIILAACSLFTPFFLKLLGSLGAEKYMTFVMRFITASSVMDSHSITIFGQSEVTTDLGYINMLFSYGIVVFVLYIVANVVAMRLFARKNMYIEYIIFLSYSVYTLMESYSASILMNVALMLLPVVLFGNTRNKYFRDTSIGK